MYPCGTSAQNRTGGSVPCPSALLLEGKGGNGWSVFNQTNLEFDWLEF